MKKRNLVLQSAIAAALVVMYGVASAGTLTTAVVGGTLFAAENFGATTTSTTDILPGTVTYTVASTNGIVISASGTIYYTIRLAGGKFKAVPLAGSITGSVLAVGGSGNGSVGTAVLSSDSTTVMFPITFSSAATLGVGSTLVYTPAAIGAATSIVGVNVTLATAGGAVSANGSLSAINPVVTSPSSTTSPNTGTAQASDVDGAVTTAVMAVSANAIIPTSSSLVGYTGKIDLTAIPAASNYALAATPGTAVVVKLGSVTFTDKASPTPTLLAGASTVYNTSAANTSTSTTILVTPGTGQAFPIGSVLSVSVAGDQCATRVGASSALTATTSILPVTLTVPATTSGTAIEVCMTAPSTGNVATPLTATLVGSLSGAAIAATTKPSTVTGLGYALDYNGARYDIRSYIPASTVGYTSFVRVINTGTVTAAVSGQWLYENGTVSSTAVLIASQVAGASSTLSSTQIETALGAPTAIGSNRPRLRLTAQTNGLQVQSFFLTNANGNFSDVTGAQ